MSLSPQYLLPLSAASTAVGAAFALAAPEGRWLPAALWHLVFAVGALPMILAAMSYFVPVLTRSSATPRALAAAPLAALVAGLLIAGHFFHGGGALRLFAPWLALAAVAGFAAWIAVRRRVCLGPPNPCLAWYAAALGLLALGLLAVAAAPFFPELLRPLRLFHLHVNTLGFMGLTAIGTLNVLLPTVAGRPDADAVRRLTLDLKWSGGGALLLALGAALWMPLALAGAVLYAWPLLRLGRHAWRTWRTEILGAGSTLPLLAAAVAGLVLALGHGGMHALGAVAGAGAVALFVVAFLLPLVSGAAGHLLPVWLRPGIQDAWHRDSRRRLARGARLRAVLLLGGGLMAGAGTIAGYAVGAAAALWLVLAVLAVFVTRR